MKVLTRRNAALKNTAVTSRAIRASVIHKKSNETLAKRTSKVVKKEIVKEASPNTKTLTKENVKPENTGKKRGRPFKTPQSKKTSPKSGTLTNGTLNHTANKAQTKEKRSITKTEKKLSDDGSKTTTTQKISNGKTRNSCNITKKSTTSVDLETTTEVIDSSSEKSIEKNNNVTSGVLTKGPFSANTSVAETSKKTDRKYQCGICMKVFLGSNDLRKHLRIHSDERPYACPHCDKRFRQGGCLKNHIASQHGTDTLYTCDYCSKTFPIKERLRLHIRIHTGEKPYRCEYCPKTFARGGQLTQHLVTHTGLKKFKCDHCGQKFSSAANLRLHQKTHLDERDFTCHLCGKGFYRPDALKKHISCYHHNIKAFHCKICNKMFKGHLPQHKRTHKHIKKHGCSTCGATFSQRSQLVVHQRIHSGERPYRCQVCWQAFAHSSVLKLHIRKHTGEKPFKCPICVTTNLGFSQLPHLKKHLKSIHGQDKPYMCENCKEFFKTKYDIQQHSFECVKEETVGSVEELIERTIRNNHASVEPPMPVARMRLLIAILLKKISSEERLRQLGYEKRLIDNVLIDSLKCAGREACESTDLTEAQRLKTNVQEFLEWTVPAQYMENFKRQHRSTEEILEELTN